MVIDMSEISERLLAEITEKGYSYGELSKLTGIPKSAIQRYATGETEKIPIPRLQQLASVLGVPSSYFFGWTNKDGSPVEERREFAMQTYEDRRLIELYHKADERDQDIIWSILGRYTED